MHISAEVANSVDVDQTAPLGCLIWVCTVSRGLSVPIHGSFIVFKFSMAKIYTVKWSGSTVVDNTVNCQSRECKMISYFSGLLDETLNQGPIST